LNDRHDAMRLHSGGDSPVVDIVGTSTAATGAGDSDSVVAAVAIAVSITNSMSEGGGDCAPARDGARRATISLLSCWSRAIMIWGSAAGIIGGHLVVAAAKRGPVTKRQGLSLRRHFTCASWSGYSTCGCRWLGRHYGLGPGGAAYRTDVAKNYGLRAANRL